MVWRTLCLAGVLLALALLLPACGGGGAEHDPALVGVWSQTAQTDNGAPVSLTEKFLLSVNADDPYRVDTDAAGVINWETGTWSTSGDSLNAVCRDSSVPGDVGKHRDFTYGVVGDTLTLTSTETVDSTAHTYISTFRRLGSDAQLVGQWLQVSLTQDGTPVSPLPTFVLTVSDGGAYAANTQEGSEVNTESGDWGIYDTTMVAIARSATSAGDVGKQHIAQYQVSGATLTLTYTETEASAEHDYVAVFARLATAANLAGVWMQTSRTANDVDVTAEQRFLLTVNADGTYRADTDEPDSVNWQTGNWGVTDSTLVAVCTGSNVPADIGRLQVAQYTLSGDVLTLTYSEDVAAAPVTVVMTLVRMTGNDAALVGKWSQESMTDNGTPAPLTDHVLLTVNAGGTYRQDVSPVDLDVPVSWESGIWLSSAPSVSPKWLVGVAQASSVPGDVGRQHPASYVLNGANDTLTFTAIELVSGTPHTLVMTFRRLGSEVALVGAWTQTSLTEDGAPVTPVPDFHLTVNADTTYSATVEGGTETGEWGVYGTTLVAIARTAPSATDVGKQHVSTYGIGGGTILTLTYSETHSGVTHAYVATFSKD